MPDLIVGQFLAAGPLSRFWTTLQLIMALVLTLFTRWWLVLLDSTPLGDLSSIPVIIAAAGVGVVINYLALQLFSLFYVSLWVFFTPKLRQGVLGEHQFELKSEGFLERTIFNETLHAWSALDRPRVIGNLVMLPTGAGRWHIIPRRSFSNQEEEKQFLREVEGRLAT